MKFILNLVKRIVGSIIIIFSVNLIIYSSNFIIPLNIYTIGILTFLGIPGLLSVVAVMMLI